MQILRFLSILSAALAAPLVAQKVYDSANEGVVPRFLTTAGDWFVQKRSNAAPTVLTAAQYLLQNNNANPVTQEVGIWDEDPTTGKPRNLLGSGSFTIPGRVPGYFGAKFSTPVPLTSAGNYFIGVKMVSNVGVSVVTTGTVTPHWWNPTSGWSGPHPTGGWSFRIYFGGHAGATATYGTGLAGSGNFVPQIEGVGWPNTTNPFGVRMTQGLGGAPVLFLFGTRIQVSLPFGTVYAFPMVVIPGTASGAGPGAGYATVELIVPNDPALNGQKLSSQAFLADSGSTTGASHTAGLEITLGH
jgi:hypothetical protein